MKSQIIQIGNSQGIRIPKALLEESRLTGEVDIELHPDGLLIRKMHVARDGWNEAFKSAAEGEEDEMLGGDASNRFDGKEWQW